MKKSTSLIPARSAAALALLMVLAGCNGHDETVGAATGTGTAVLPPNVQFTITPDRVAINGTAILDWKVLNATADTTCEGRVEKNGQVISGPAARPVESTHAPYSTGNPAVTTKQAERGNYDYILSCTGPGGTTHAVQRLVVGGPVVTLELIPSQIQVGETAVLKYTTDGAKTCFAETVPANQPRGWQFDSTFKKLDQGDKNGDGVLTESDKQTPAGGQIVLGSLPGQAFTVPGIYLFSLVCSDVEGTVPADFVGRTSLPITKALTVGNVSSVPKINLRLVDAQIVPGATARLFWGVDGSPASTTCTAGGATVPNWNGSKSVSSGVEGLTIGPFTNAGEYSLTMSCTGPFGITSDTVTVSVFNTTCDDTGLRDPDDTDLGQRRITLLQPAALPSESVSLGASSNCLLSPLSLCGVSNTGNVVDRDPANYATMSLRVGLGLAPLIDDKVSISLTDVSTINPVNGRTIDPNACEYGDDNRFGIPKNAVCASAANGRRVGFVVSNPDALLTLALFKSITIVTSLKHFDGRPEEGGDSDPDSRFDIDLLTLLSGLGVDRERLYLADVLVKKPANTVKIELSGSVAGLLSDLRVYNACVTTP